jgi:hypothetical protein
MPPYLGDTCPPKRSALQCISGQSHLAPPPDLSRFSLALMGHHINTRRESHEMKRPLVKRDIQSFSCSDAFLLVTPSYFQELFVGVLVMMWSLGRTPTTAGKRCEVRGDHTLYVDLSPLSIWPLAPVSEMKHSKTLLRFPSAHSNSTFTQHASSTHARGTFCFFVSL